MTARNEPTPTQRVRAALMRERDQMHKKRLYREFETVYADSHCKICGQIQNGATLCRKNRGWVCAEHCESCSHYRRQFGGHCLFNEENFPDVQKWQLVAWSENKDELQRGIKQRLHKNAAEEPAQNVHRYIIGDAPDEQGDFAIIEIETGEIMPFVAKYLKDINVWACVRYIEK